MEKKRQINQGDPGGSEGDIAEGSLNGLKNEIDDLVKSSDMAIANVMNVNAQDFLRDHQQEGGQ